MKKLKNVSLISILAMTFGAAMVLTSCGEKLKDEPLNAKMVADYTKEAEDHKEMFASGSKGYSWENGEPFNVWWKAENVSYENKKLSLSLSEMTEKEKVWDAETETFVDAVAEYYGAEERSEHYYGYGDFQVRMKPSKVKGTASTFFTCTGPYDVWYNSETGEVERANDHDEIDIEFLGKDTTKVQFNYFANGVGGHEYMYSLGFDASKEFHDYGFRWTENDITWFVDQKPVYKVKRADIKKGEEWPEDPGRMVMNYWCGTQKASAWMGAFEDDYSGHAEYEWVKASSEQFPDPASSKPVLPPNPGDELDVPTEGWVDIDYSSYDGWGMYDVSKENGIQISHTGDMSGYKCSGMSLANSYKWVKFHVKNNEDVAADLRIDVKKEGGAGAIEAVSPANETVSYDATEKAAMIHLEANEETDVVLKIKEEVVNQMVVFLNSTGSGLSTKGNITITGLQGIVSEVTPGPEPIVEEGILVNETLVAFESTTYTMTYAEDNSTMDVQYESISGQGYTNLEGNIASIVGENDTIGFQVTNLGEEVSKIRIDIMCNPGEGTPYTNGGTSEGKNDFCNVSATVEGALEYGNDYDYTGGDWVKVSPQETATVSIQFTKGVGAKSIKLFIDSSTWDDASVHTNGHLRFANMTLSVHEGGDQPVGDEWTAMDLSSFDGWGSYTVVKENSSQVEIKHDTARDLYACCGADITLGTYNVVKVKVANRGSEVARVKIAIKNNNNATSAITSATIDGTPVDYVEYGALATIEPGSTVEYVMHIDVAQNADKFVVSFNSEGEGTNPATGDIVIFDAFYQVAE